MENTNVSLSSVYNFIINFKPEEIDDVLYDFELQRNGFKILYAVDTYDIVSHYLPYTEGGLFQNKNKNELAQKLICYDYFFSPDPSIDNDVKKRKVQSIIVMDEYKIELLGAKNKIIRQLKNIGTIKRNLDDLKKETASFGANEETTKRYFEQNFEILLLLLILNEKENTILVQFEEFLTNRLVINNIVTGLVEDDDLINDAFQSAKKTSLTLALFDKFVKENGLDILSIRSETERYVYLENTFRDAQAIDRLVHINERFQSQGKKIIILYLSSAPFKTKELFKNLRDLNTTSPSVGRENFVAINRNIFQCFLLEMLVNEFSEEHLDVRKALHSLKKVSHSISSTTIDSKNLLTQDLDQNDIIVLKKLKSVFDQYSSSLDNHFYLRIYDKYRGLYNATAFTGLKPKGLPVSSELKNMFQQIDKLVNSQEFRQKYFDFNFTIKQLKTALEFAISINQSRPIVPEILFGNDIIKNSFHHLPYLLFLQHKGHEAIYSGFYELLNNLIDISSTKHHLIESLKEKLKIAANNVVQEYQDLDRISIQQISLCYINIITVKNENTPVESSSKEEDIIETLEYHKSLLTHLKVEGIYDADAERLEVVFKPHKFVPEIDYLLLWLYRRNKQIDISIELGRLNIKRYPDDPRFFHGLALAYISRAYENVKMEITGQENNFDLRKDFKQALLCLKFAKEKYQQTMSTFFGEHFGLLVVKNYMAVLNSLADVSLRIHELEIDKDFSRVQEARLWIQEVKEISKNYNIIYNHFPVFSGTELEIEYQEAKYCFENNMIATAHEKILNAINRKGILEQLHPDSPIESQITSLKKEVQYLFMAIVDKL